MLVYYVSALKVDSGIGQTSAGVTMNKGIKTSLCLIIPVNGIVLGFIGHEFQ